MRVDVEQQSAVDREAAMRRDMAPFLKVARSLGEDVGEGVASQGAASEVIEFIAEAASERLGRYDKSGVRLRLVWEMRDAARSQWLVRQRRTVNQERRLADAGASVLRAGGTRQQARTAIAELAGTMNPLPRTEQLDAAWSLAQWRAKWLEA